MATNSLSLIDAGSEEIYPNSVDGKYFTATQARIYVGKLFLDEMVAIQFTYQGNRIPIYGYCSTHADAFGKGRYLVQGQLAINFVANGYLYTVLDEYRKLGQTSRPTSQDVNINLMSQAVTAAAATALSPGTRVITPAQSETQANALSIQLNQIQTLAQTLGPAGIDAYNASLKGETTRRSAIDLDVPFDIRFQLSGANRTITKTIRGCELISNDQQFDQAPF